MNNNAKNIYIYDYVRNKKISIFYHFLKINEAKVFF